MTYCVRDAEDGLAVDTSFPVSPSLARLLAATPIQGERITAVCQYVGLAQNGSGDINGYRLAGILDAGLSLWLVQHCLNPGWEASGALGKQLGATAKQNASLAGYAPGAHLGLDLEGCRSVGQPVIDYVCAWADQVAGVYPVVLYVGYAAGLGSRDLFERLTGVHLYWKDNGPRKVDQRGFAVEQGLQLIHCGIPVDTDRMHADAFGVRLRVMCTQEPGVAA